MPDQQTAHCQILTPAFLVARRISESALHHYLRAVLVELRTRLETSSLTDSSFQVAVLLSKDRQPVFEVQHFGLPPEHQNLRDELEDELAKLAWPPLQSGAEAPQLPFLETAEDGAALSPKGQSVGRLSYGCLWAFLLFILALPEFRQIFAQMCVGISPEFT